MVTVRLWMRAKTKKMSIIGIMMTIEPRYYIFTAEIAESAEL